MLGVVSSARFLQLVVRYNLTTGQRHWQLQRMLRLYSQVRLLYQSSEQSTVLVTDDSMRKLHLTDICSCSPPPGNPVRYI